MYDHIPAALAGTRSSMWIELGVGVSTRRGWRKNRDMRRFTELTHARAALVGMELRKGRHSAYKADTGGCATTNVNVFHDMVGIRGAVELVAATSPDAEDQEG